MRWLSYNFDNPYQHFIFNVIIKQVALFNVFRKHNQRHKYNTIEEYQNLLHLIKSPNDNTRRVFHVIGLSLDKSDAIILKHISFDSQNLMNLTSSVCLQISA